MFVSCGQLVAYLGSDCWLHWSLTLTSKSWRFKAPAIWSASSFSLSCQCTGPGILSQFSFLSLLGRINFIWKLPTWSFASANTMLLLFFSCKKLVGVPVIIVFNHWKLLTVFNNTFQKFYSNPLSVRFSVRLLFLREICLKVTPQNVNNLKVFILISLEFMLNVPRVKKEIY